MKKNPGSKHFANILTSWEGMWNVMQSLPNPDPVLRKMAGGGGVEIYEELMSDGYLSGALTSRWSGSVNREWKVERGDIDETFFQIYEEWFYSTITFNFKQEFVPVSFWGYMPHELWEWEEINGFFFPKIRAKPPKWFFYGVDEDGNPKLMFRNRESGLLSGGVDVPDFKILVPTFFGSYDNPYGWGLASKCFWPVVMKRGGWEFFATFLERYADPKLVHTLAEGDVKEDTEKLVIAQNLYDMVRDGVVVLENGETLAALDDKATGRTDGYSNFIAMQDKVMAITVLNHALALDTPMGGGGSYAATYAAMSGPRGDLISMDLMTMGSFFESLARLIKAYNGLPVKREGPYHTPYESDALYTDIVERDAKLYSIGWRPLADYFTHRYELDPTTFYVEHQGTKKAEPVEESGDTDQAGSSADGEIIDEDYDAENFEMDGFDEEDV